MMKFKMETKAFSCTIAGIILVLSVPKCIVLQAKLAANSTVTLARDIQDKLKQCRQCNNNASGSAKQVLKTTDACKLKDEMKHSLTSAFNLDGIDSYSNTSCDQTKISVSVRFILLLTSVYCSIIENILITY